MSGHSTSMDTDHHLLRSWAVDGDQGAFATLVRRYTPLVWSACRRRLADAASADDATQAVFVLLSRRAQRLLQRPWWGPTTIADWLHRSAVRTAANARRAAQRRLHHEQQGAAAMRESQMPPVEAHTTQADGLDAALDDALRSLSSRYRAPLVMHYLGERPRAEIARELGVSEDAIHKRIERGLAMLRQRLGRSAVAALVAIPGAQRELAHARVPDLLERLQALRPSSPSMPMTTLGIKIAATVLLGACALTALGMSAWHHPLRHPGSRPATVNAMINASVLVSANAPPTTAMAQAPDLTSRLAASRARAVAYLLAHQDPATGAWTSITISPIALTGLVIRALDGMADPTPALRRARTQALGYLAAIARANHGRLVDALAPPTYAQAIATLVLAEHVRELSDGLPLVAQASAILLAAQSTVGGWRYALEPRDADLSVTGDVVLALTAAQACGACDAQGALARARRYLVSCADLTTGGFTYSPNPPNPPRDPASALPPLQVPPAGQQLQTSYRTALGALALDRISGPSPLSARAHQALMQGWVEEQAFGLIGDAFANEALRDDPQCMPTWAARVLPDLLARQGLDGSWSDRMCTPLLGTALGLRALAATPALAGWEALTQDVRARTSAPTAATAVRPIPARPASGAPPTF